MDTQTVTLSLEDIRRILRGMGYYASFKNRENRAGQTRIYVQARRFDGLASAYLGKIEVAEVMSEQQLQDLITAKFAEK